MVWVDIAIIALLAIYSVVGIFRGYSQEAYSLIAWVIGIIVAWFFSKDFALLLIKTIGSPSTRLAVAFIALILITLMTVRVINLLAGNAKKTGLTLLDRTGGLVLGFGHGLLVVFAMVVVAGLTPLPKDRWWQESIYLPPFQSFALIVKKNIATKLASSINYQ